MLLKIIKILQSLLIVSALLMSNSILAKDRVLDTANYLITISSQCEEGEVICNSYQYLGVSKQSGQSIQLVGSSWYRMCSDGQTPCQFLGYRFKNRTVTYFISNEGSIAVVTDKGKILLQESGRWQLLYDQ